MKENQLDSEKIIIGDILNDLEAKKSTNDFLHYVFNIMTLFQLKIERYLSILKIN